MSAMSRLKYVLIASLILPGYALLEMRAGVIHGEHPAVVEVLDKLHPGLDELAHLAGVSGQVVEVVGQHFGGAQRQPHARRKHRIDETKRIARHHPARAVAALGDELVVRINGHLADPAAVLARVGELRIAGDGRFEPFLRRGAEGRGLVLVQDDADRQAVAQRDAPAPARVIHSPDDDLPARRMLDEAFVVRKVGDVLARADFRRNLHGPRKKPAASGGIDQQIRLLPAEPRRLFERLAGKLQAVRADALDLRPHLGALRAEFIRALIEEPVERGPRRIVGVSRQDAVDGFETKIDLLVASERESHAGLVLADRGGALLDAEPAQDRDDRRDQRFAHDQVRPAAIVEDGDVHALLREETRPASRPRGRCR